MIRTLFSRQPDRFAVLIAWTAVVLITALVVLTREQLSLQLRFISILMYGVVLGFYLIQVQPNFHPALLSRFGRPVVPAVLVVGLLFGLHLLYGTLIGRLLMRELLLGLLLLAVPTALAFVARSRPVKLTYPDIFLILSIWLPVEFGWLPGITIPPEQGIATVYHLYAIILAIFLFRTVRVIPDMGLQLLIKRWDINYALLMSTVFLFVFALPIGLLTGFIGFGLRKAAILEYPGAILGIAFFIALPEEILFRGIIQKLIEKTVPDRPGLALGYASVIFGIAHANNNNPPFWSFELGGLGLIQLPWVYIILATIAGWFYGKTYQRTNNLAAAALVHTIVDGVWWMFFSNV